MKFIYLFFFFIAFSSLHAQVIVKDRPHSPRQVMTSTTCDAKSIWVRGHWVWDKKQEQYLWVKGACQKLRKGNVYQSGVWRKVKQGWIWVPGKWAKVNHYSSIKHFPR